MMETPLTTLEETRIIAMAGILLLLVVWESVQPFYDFFTGALKSRGKHAGRNLIMGAINSLLVSLVFVGVWLAAAVWADEHRFGIMHWLQDTAGFPPWAHAGGAVLLFDLWTYTWHRMNHEIPFFWRFHSVHHSDNTMDVTTASRFHFGEIVFSSLLRIPVIALLGVYLWELVFYEIMMFAVVQFHHANVNFPEKYDRVLRTLIVTPNMHRVHHSRWQPETDSNYSAFFSVWDRIVRTFRLNPHPATITLGLDAFDRTEAQTIRGMMTTPVKKTR